MIERITALIIKEILVLLRNPKGRRALIIPIFIQLFIFAFAATLDVKNVPIGILNLDNGEKSVELIQRFYGSPTFNKVIFLKSANEIPDFLDMQRGVLVMSIDEQFSRKIDAKQAVSIEFILDGRRSNTAQVVAGYGARILQEFNQDIAAQVGYNIQTTKLFARNWYNPNLLYHWFTLPSLVVLLTTSIGLSVTALSVAREREMGTFDQLLVSAVSPFEIMLGKMLPAVLIAIAEGSIIVLAAIFVFQIPFTGHLLYLYMSLLVFVCSIVGVGLFMSSLCSTQQQATLGTLCFMSPAVSLSGFATPVENMPEWLQYATCINPLRYMLIISRGQFLKNAPLDVVLDNVWPMALIAVFTLSASTWFFRRKLA